MNLAFQPSWHLENGKDIRGNVMKRLNTFASKFTPQLDSIKVVPLWHGTADSVVRNICETGFAALATTDDGYFGRGLYFTNSAGKSTFTFCVI